jgi:hypothetical protein
MGIIELLVEAVLRTGVTIILTLLLVCLVLTREIDVGIRIVAGMIGLPTLGILGASGLSCVQQLSRRFRGS